MPRAGAGERVARPLVSWRSAGTTAAIERREMSALPTTSAKGARETPKQTGRPAGELSRRHINGVVRIRPLRQLDTEAAGSEYGEFVAMGHSSKLTVRCRRGPARGPARAE